MSSSASLFSDFEKGFCNCNVCNSTLTRYSYEDDDSYNCSEEKYECFKDDFDIVSMVRNATKRHQIIFKGRDLYINKVNTKKSKRNKCFSSKTVQNACRVKH